MTVVSLFAGIGGFDLGFENAGMTTVAQVEIDPQCREVLATHFPKAERFDDVRDFKWTRPIDVVCGGFPCQDLSVAGRRKGLAGERSGLFWEAHRIVAESKPRLVVIENVHGLLSSNEGRDMETVVRSLVELGYGVCWRVLDSQYFGVAQRRRRVFIVGSLGDGRSAEILFEPESLCGNPPPRREKGQGASTDVAASIGVRMRGLDDSCADNLQVCGTLAASGAGSSRPAGNANETDLVIPFTTEQTPKARTDGLAHCLTKGSPTGGGHPQAVAVRTAQTSSNGWGVSDSAYCLDGANGQAVQQRLGVRRLTPVECERLQGFPDGWTEGFSDSARYRMLGNAVTVNVSRWIGEKLMETVRI